MSERLTQADLLRFAYGEADELEEQILGDATYLEAVEEIWASELPHDLRTPIVRALQMQKFVGDTFGAAIDVAIKFTEAIPHYLAAGTTEPEASTDPEGTAPAEPGDD
jgi:hypothetical protein